MASAQKDAEEDRLRIAAALGNDKKKLRELAGNSRQNVAQNPAKAGTASAPGKSKERPVVQVRMA